MKKYKFFENNIEYDVEEYDNRDKFYYKNNLLHRENGPAIEFASGNKVWYKEDKLHREDGPAIEFANGDKLYYYNGERVNVLSDKDFNKFIKEKNNWVCFHRERSGKLHRENGPAIEWANGDGEWFKDGKRHREDGPAIEYASGNIQYASGNIQYWYNGERINVSSDKEFIKYIKLKAFW